jgi:hypothetical protein
MQLLLQYLIIGLVTMEKVKVLHYRGEAKGG